MQERLRCRRELQGTEEQEQRLRRNQEYMRSVEAEPRRTAIEAEREG